MKKEHSKELAQLEADFNTKKQALLAKFETEKADLSKSLDLKHKTEVNNVETKYIQKMNHLKEILNKTASDLDKYLSLYEDLKNTHEAYVKKVLVRQQLQELS